MSILVATHILKLMQDWILDNLGPNSDLRSTTIKIRARLASTIYLWTRVFFQFRQSSQSQTFDFWRYLTVLIISSVIDHAISETKDKSIISRPIGHNDHVVSEIEAVWSKVAKESLAEGIIVLDEADKVQGFNRQALALLGMDESSDRVIEDLSLMPDIKKDSD